MAAHGDGRLVEQHGVFAVSRNSLEPLKSSGTVLLTGFSTNEDACNRSGADEHSLLRVEVIDQLGRITG
jgi:hypothetical protein